jgi:hypothetical protein
VTEDGNRRGQSIERMRDFDRFEAEDDGWRAINGEDLEGGDNPAVGPWVIEKLVAEDACPYCGRDLRRSYHSWGDVPEGLNCREWTLIHCPGCAFWQFFGKHGLLNDFPSRVYWEAHIAKARSFTVSLPAGCEHELAQALRRNPSHWALLDPRRLETYVAEILRANYAPCDVTHLGRPGDGGVDILFIDSEMQQWVVQVKRRARRSSEPVDTLRNLLGVMYADGRLRGIVVSTADHFTYRSYELQRKVAQKGCIIELVDRGKLDLMLSPLIPRRPWAGLQYEYDGDLDEGLNRRDVFQMLEEKLEATPLRIAPRGKKGRPN